MEPTTNNQQPATNYKYIYFLGIGGIGMSAIARWFKANGKPVWGYDKTETVLTQNLKNEGIEIHFEDNVALIPREVLENKTETLVVLTPAVPQDHTELNFFRREGYTIKKRSEVLGIITASAYTIAVAGTHGKTSTSSMVAHLLHAAGVDCSAFLGGISVNLNSNLAIGKAEKDGKPIVVVEADEYDRSFLTLHPDIAIVTSSDADHLDIYGDKDQLIHSFQDFISQVKPGGTLILNKNTDPRLTEKMQPGVNLITYALTQGDLKASEIKVSGRTFGFDLESVDKNIPDLALNVPGFHNVENMLAAIQACLILNVPENAIQNGVKTYKGVKRRFEYVFENESKVYIDDYAHHPTEIEAFVRSVKALYPGKKLKLIFQPHLFTRTRDFANGFAQTLSQADEVVLLEIYPAREKPIPGITSKILLEKINSSQKTLLTKEEVLLNLQSDKSWDVLATVGAGDIDTLVQPIKNILEKL
ncbi:UDP-N-acetylmuramate--L-alanine ligase [Adhaeribacter sp. BT258]|uniref:UDP-N-acetylmuramate--L-alanine ligase n=1 Tax=Adhaeribacter terrigena TaxID=2793070 RepID=A0ABS1BYM4_9BACT|nr:UDP-N-acetylmuramate--L-alanine ligase [Adhaeribacter terrigena]MBK0402210.1 UDP-N-acetylmuramate--L-alanine ligase [Adhaeribacter terrigena]